MDGCVRKFVVLGYCDGAKTCSKVFVLGKVKFLMTEETDVYLKPPAAQYFVEHD